MSYDCLGDNLYDSSARDTGRGRAFHFRIQLGHEYIGPECRWTLREDQVTGTYLRLHAISAGTERNMSGTVSVYHYAASYRLKGTDSKRSERWELQGSARETRSDSIDSDKAPAALLPTYAKPPCPLDAMCPCWRQYLPERRSSLLYRYGTAVSVYRWPMNSRNAGIGQESNNQSFLPTVVLRTL